MRLMELLSLNKNNREYSNSRGVDPETFLYVWVRREALVEAIRGATC